MARAYEEESGSYRLRALGDFDDLADPNRSAAAKKEAEAFAKKVEAGGVVEAKLETVGEACRTFGETRLEAEGPCKRCVYGDPVTKVRRDRLRERHLIEWRSRLEVRPAHRGMAVIRAALSKVVAPGTPQVRSCMAGSLAVYSAPSCSRSVIDGRAMAA
jgi:hypothetical protein